MMVVLGCKAVVEYRSGSVSWAVAYGALAVLFQPILKVEMDRGMWNVVDVVVAVGILVMLARKVRGERLGI